MKAFSLLVFLGATVGLPAIASAQQMVGYVVATNFDAQGRVLELDFPAAIDGLPFYVTWQTDKGQFNVAMQARGGRHCYEMRNKAPWEGRVTNVAITVPRVPGQVKKPTLSDEVDMFLEAEAISPTTVNFVKGHSLFGVSANFFLLAILTVSAFCFARFRKMSVQLAIMSGFLFAWALASLMAVYDHVAIIRTMEKRDLGMFPLVGLTAFADRASEMIGPESWGDDLDELYGSFLHYRLAEQRYVPGTSGQTPTFWITRSPGTDLVVWEYANYYLVRKAKP